MEDLIDMEDLFVTQPSNSHQSLLLCEPAVWQGIAASINRRSLLQGWKPLEFEFQAVDKKCTKLPSICTVYFPGVIAFRSDLKSALFSSTCDQLEFLPINVAGEQWLLMNCLKTMQQFDEEKSQVLRGLSGDIFMVVKLHVTDPAARDCEMFTLAGSNHSQLFVRASLKERVKKLRLEGITFQRIGEVL